LDALATDPRSNAHRAPQWRQRLEIRSIDFRASASPVRQGTERQGRAPIAVQSNEDFMDDDISRAARAKKGSPFLSTEQAAFYLGLSPRKLQAMRASGAGPRFRRHSRFVRYHIDDLECWSIGGPQAAHA
jgi:hypothetical protein